MEDGDKILLVPAARITTCFPLTLECTRCGSAESDGAARPRANPLCHPHTCTFTPNICAQAHTSARTRTDGASLPLCPALKITAQWAKGTDVMQGAGKDRVLCKSLQTCSKAWGHPF